MGSCTLRRGEMSIMSGDIIIDKFGFKKTFFIDEGKEWLIDSHEMVRYELSQYQSKESLIETGKINDKYVIKEE